MVTRRRYTRVGRRKRRSRATTKKRWRRRTGGAPSPASAAQRLQAIARGRATRRKIQRKIQREKTPWLVCPSLSTRHALAPDFPPELMPVCNAIAAEKQRSATATAMRRQGYANMDRVIKDANEKTFRHQATLRAGLDRTEHQKRLERLKRKQLHYKYFRTPGVLGRGPNRQNMGAQRENTTQARVLSNAEKAAQDKADQEADALIASVYD